MTDVSLAAFHCKEGSPARRVGTDRTRLGPCRHRESKVGKRERGRKVRGKKVGKGGGVRVRVTTRRKRNKTKT